MVNIQLVRLGRQISNHNIHRLNFCISNIFVSENSDMIYEGDIYLDESTINLLVRLKRRTIRSAISAPHRKWPDATIPYEFGYVSKYQ